MVCNDTVVAIPAQNEVAWITRCLTALTHQQGASARVVVLVNNSVDGTATAARAIQAAGSLRIDIVEHDFQPALHSAGHARRLAMAYAVARLTGQGILLCTDADGEVASDWLAANLYHIRAGADAVAGRAIIDPQDALAIPDRLHQDDARECAYGASLDEIASLLDPDPDDPWPRHTEHSGASIAVTMEAYRRAGGVPAHRTGEDRAFFAALRRIDARIRHAMDVRVIVSGRLQGRAQGGMADTIRRRMMAPDPYLDDALEPAADAVRRARVRAAFRRAYAGGTLPAAEVLIDAGCSRGAAIDALRATAFGQVWANVERQSRRLQRRLVPVAQLPNEQVHADRTLAALRVTASQTFRMAG